MPVSPGEITTNPSAVGVQNVSGGLNLDSMSLEDLMFFVLSARVDSLDTSVRGFAKQIENRNALLKQTNDMLAQVRYNSDNLKSGEKATMSPEMVQFFKEHGIKLPDDATTSGAGGSSSKSIEEQITEAESLLESVKDKKGDADDACIDQDLPASAINQAHNLGIEVHDDGDGEGQNWEKGDFENFQSKVELKLEELRSQQANAPATVSGAVGQIADPIAARGAVLIAQANLAADPDNPELKQKLAEAQAALDGAFGGTTATGSSTTATSSPTYTSKTYTKEQWNSIISSVQGFQEGLNTDSQLDMIKFQSLMSKHSAAVELLSNITKKLSESLSSLVRNFL